MTNQKLSRLAETKSKLADKYVRLSKLASSVPKRTKFQRRAADLRYQARMLEIKANQ